MEKEDMVALDPIPNIEIGIPLEVASQYLDGDEGYFGEEENFQENIQE